MTRPGFIRRRMTAMFLFLALAAPASAVTLQGGPEDGGGKSKTAHVLALTWQPGFCLSKPKAPECAQRPDSVQEATRLSLHGLWRVKQSYCGIDAELKKRYRSSKWTDLPKLALSENTAIRLAAAMPGVVSGLDRHQWMMNGTCHAATAEDYYARSLEMLDTVNASAVGALFEAKVGKTVTIAELAAAVDATFGAGTGERVRLRCRTVGDERIVTGLTIGLNSDEGELAGLIRGASATKSRCASGLLVQAGGD